MIFSPFALCFLLQKDVFSEMKSCYFGSTSILQKRLIRNFPQTWGFQLSLLSTVLSISFDIILPAQKNKYYFSTKFFRQKNQL